MPSHDTAVVKIPLVPPWCKILPVSINHIQDSCLLILPKTPITAFVVIFHTDSKMSALVLRLAGDVTVRATITADGEHVFSVYDFMDLACPTMSDSWTKVTWRNLKADDSGNFFQSVSHRGPLEPDIVP